MFVAFYMACDPLPCGSPALRLADIEEQEPGGSCSQTLFTFKYAKPSATRLDLTTIIVHRRLVCYPATGLYTGHTQWTKTKRIRVTRGTRMGY